VKYFDLKQGSEEWINARLGVPSASNFNLILTPKTGKLSASADRYICQLIGEKKSMYGPENAENYTNKAIRWGQMTEDEARRFYSMERNVDVYNGGWCLTDDERFGCSPDGLIGDVGALELKCPQPDTHTAYLLEGGLPSDYRGQCHGQLIVTGRAWVDFLSYAPGLPPLLLRIEPDEYTDQLRKALEIFWERYQSALAKIESFAS
jgi:YqaJ-like viral recombinase domain